MRNPIAICLFILGILKIFVAFIAGIFIAYEGYDGFQFNVAISWWLSGIVAGIFLIGIGEIINLLQKLLDQNNGSVQSRKKFELTHNESNVLPNNKHDTAIIKSSDITIKDLTIMLDGERFKGQFLFSQDELKVYKKLPFQSDSDVQLIKIFLKNNISHKYEKKN